MPELVKPQQPPPALDVWHCRACHAVLGVSSGAALTVGAAIFSMPVTIHCARCGAARKWRPRTDRD
jgi:RNase P subunit RPR2